MSHPTLDQAIKAAQTGRRATARRGLARLVGDEPDNKRAWLWLAAVLDEEEQRLYCLRQVQRLDPHNPAIDDLVRELAGRIEPDSPPPAPDRSSDASPVQGERPTRHRDAAATGRRDAAATGRRDAAATGRRDAAATGRRDAAATGRRDAAATGHRDAAATGHRDAAATGRRDAAATGRRDAAATGRRDAAATGRRDAAATLGTPRTGQ